MNQDCFDKRGKLMKLIARRFLSIWIIIMIFMLSACSLTKPLRLPAVSSYTLGNLPKINSSRRSKTQLTLLVSTPIASPGYQSSSMIYMMIPYRLKAFVSHRWVAPPATMLLPLLAESLQARHYFHAVVTPPFTGVTDYRLITHLLVMRQEFIQPTSQVRIVMEADLINNRTGRVIADRRFQVLQQAPENNPYSGVLAMNRAARMITAKIAAFVLRNLKR